MGKLLSVVVSVYNEEQVLPEFYRTVRPILDGLSWDYELLFVDDGSQDQSRRMLDRFAAENPRVSVLHFSRNFGHESAMIAGIDYSRGDGVVCMDADLQHPPELLPQIVGYLEEGYGVINMVRTKNLDANIFKRITSAAFYKVINAMSQVKFEPNASDFFAISAQAADVLRTEYRERVRFLRGFVQCIGFPKTVIRYEAKKRAGGASKYSFGKLMKLSVNSLLCFSDMPLKLGVYSGLIVALIGIIIMIETIVDKMVNGAPSGYATIVVLLCFMFSLVLIIIGIIGEYISVLFTEIKNRPIYTVEAAVNREEISGRPAEEKSPSAAPPKEPQA